MGGGERYDFRVWGCLALCSLLSALFFLSNNVTPSLANLLFFLNGEREKNGGKISTYLLCLLLIV